MIILSQQILQPMYNDFRNIHIILKHLIYKQANIWYTDLFKAYGPASFIPNDGAHVHSRNNHDLNKVST